MKALATLIFPFGAGRPSERRSGEVVFEDLAKSFDECPLAIPSDMVPEFFFNVGGVAGPSYDQGTRSASEARSGP